jgi:signal transduction histidine kinase
MLDSQRMTQVFMNLLLNAMQAMPAERENKQITIEVAPTQSSACITIKDNGTGITPESMEKLFTPFFTTKKKGTGLGLSIVQRIIEEHGGKIMAQSTVNVGTTFTITLPLAEKTTVTEKMLGTIEDSTQDVLFGIEDGTANTSALLSEAFTK